MFTTNDAALVRARRFGWPAPALLWPVPGTLGLWQAVRNQKVTRRLQERRPDVGRAMKKSWSLAAGRAGAAVVTCGVLLSACGGGTGRHAAGPDAPVTTSPGHH